MRKRLGNTYICSSDDYFTENPFEPYVWKAYYAVEFAEGPTPEWCVQTGAHDRIIGATIGGENAWYMIGHVYFDHAFSETYVPLLDVIYDKPDTKDKLWEHIYLDNIKKLDMVARRYPAGAIFEFDSLDEEIEARKGRGCHLFIFSGGNPLAREQETIALCNKHTDCVFAAFTPPRFITGELCADLLRVRNLFPAIQVDEDGADATRATALLRRYKLPFGVACRCTAENAERVATELYYDRVIATGAKFCWFFTCPAYGPEQPASLEQLEAIHRRVQEFRRSKPLLTLDFWDGPSPSAAAPQGGTA